MNDYLSGESIVSRSGTRLLVGPQKHGAGRITTWCEFGIPRDEGPFEATRDCEFCRKEVEQARRRKELEDAQQTDRITGDAA